MPEPSLPEESIFAQALEIEPAGDRAAFLDRICAGNPALRAEVEALLGAAQKSGDLLDLPEGPAVTIDLPAGEAPGTVIGPYKLLEQIGEGGMGAVWMAEQTEPIQRRVALKVIKEGMDSKQVLARFEAERQALALMDHPNIAKVLDAGRTPSGRPYFVMELVKGQPITAYCDVKRLGVRERLELFGDVCRAVQHAHQKGIIHRDLKPSNVLVAPYDGKPVVKVIDFGVAKATGQRLTDKTLFTGFGALVGTPEYMSPEQAEVNNQDIDTRSDIYSLGVLLYELLTGSTPLTRKRIKEAALLEVLRVIREEEPPKPSTRLSDSKDSLPSISAQRHTEPAKLTKLVRGELDWIVMKALDKDRSRRYETANGFAMDVQRYLADEPVQACPPTVGYRLRKFTRRNKKGLAVAALVLFFFALLGAGGGWVIRDRAAREYRLTSQVEQFLDEVGRLEREQKWPEAQAAAERAEAAVATGEAGDALRQRVRDVRRDLAFVARLEEIRLGRDFRRTTQAYAQAFRDYGVDVEQLPTETAIDRLRSNSMLAVRLASALDDWFFVRVRSGENEASRKLLLAVARGVDPDPLRDRLRVMWDRPISPASQAELRNLAESIDVKSQGPATLSTLADILSDFQLADLAILILRNGQSAYPDDFWLNFDLGFHLDLGRNDYMGAARYYAICVALRPNSTAAHHNLGSVLRRTKDFEGAIREFQAALTIDPNFAEAHNNLGAARFDQGDWEGAIREYQAALKIDPDYAGAYYNLGNALRDKGQWVDAIDQFREALRLKTDYPEAHTNLGTALRMIGDLDGAIAELRKAIASNKSFPERCVAHFNLARALRQNGQRPEAFAEFCEGLRLQKAGTEVRKAPPNKGQSHAVIADEPNANPSATDLAEAHFRFGYDLQCEGYVDDAISEYRDSIGLNQDSAEAHCNLGLLLRQKGQFREAVDELRRGHELGSKRAAWPYRSADWLRESEHLIALDEKLPGFLARKTTPASAAECIELAQLCQVYRKQHGAAARFYDEAFAADPNLAEERNSHRYNAARAAALAGCGQGKDVETLDDKERARLRRQALDWLRADLDAWGRLLDKEPDEIRPVIVEQLRHWRGDADLAGVHSPAPLAKLSQPERAAWQQLWDDVANTLARAQAKKTPDKKAGGK